MQIQHQILQCLNFSQTGVENSTWYNNRILGVHNNLAGITDQYKAIRYVVINKDHKRVPVHKLSKTCTLVLIIEPDSIDVAYQCKQQKFQLNQFTLNTNKAYKEFNSVIKMWIYSK